MALYILYTWHCVHTYIYIYGTVHTVHMAVRLLYNIYICVYGGVHTVHRALCSFYIICI